MGLRLSRHLRRGAAIGTAALLAGSFVLACLFGLTEYRIASSSMEPTLHCAGAPRCLALRSDRILAVKGLLLRLSPIRRGDIIAFHQIGHIHSSPATSALVIKRVVGLPGDTVSEKVGVIRVNGKVLDEPYVRERDARTFVRQFVPGHAYFVLGDNRVASRDSRDFGAVAQSAVAGKVILRLSPLNRVKLLP